MYSVAGASLLITPPVQTGIQQYIPQNTYRGQCVSIALAETVDTGVAKLPIRPCQGKKSVERIEFPQRPPPAVDPSMSGWKVGG